MANSAAHDAAVKALLADLSNLFRPRFESDRLMILSRPESRREVSGQDVIVMKYLSDMQDLHNDRTRWSARTVMVVEVVDASDSYELLMSRVEGYESCLVPEYVLFDPEEKVIRPGMEAYRLVGDRYRRWPSSHGVYFSPLGFRLDDVGGRLAVSSCGPADIEDRLFQQEVRLASARDDADKANRTVAELEIEVERLKALLRQAGLPNGNGGA